MKIEIEYEEIERLKAEIFRQKLEISRLEKSLSFLNEKDLKDRAEMVAHSEANKYISAVFKKLGFNQLEPVDIIRFDFMQRFNKRDWYESDDITIEVGAHIVGQMRNAFLNIGVITKEE